MTPRSCSPRDARRRRRGPERRGARAPGDVDARCRAVRAALLRGRARPRGRGSSTRSARAEPRARGRHARATARCSAPKPSGARCSSATARRCSRPTAPAHVEARLEALRALRAGDEPARAGRARARAARTPRARGQARRRGLRRAVRPRRPARPRARGVRRRPLPVAAARARAPPRAQRAATGVDLLWPAAELDDARAARRTSTCRRSTTARTERGRRAAAARPDDRVARRARARLPRSRPEGPARAARRRRARVRAARAARARDRSARPERAMARGARADAPLRPGVLDRLMAPPRPAGRGGARRGRIRASSAATVARDLDWLLNTKRWLPEELHGLPRGEPLDPQLRAAGPVDVLLAQPGRRDRDRAPDRRGDPPLRAAPARSAASRSRRCDGSDAATSGCASASTRCSQVEPVHGPVSFDTDIDLDASRVQVRGELVMRDELLHYYERELDVHPQAGRRVRGEVPRGRRPAAARADGQRRTRTSSG